MPHWYLGNHFAAVALMLLSVTTYGRDLATRSWQAAWISHSAAGRDFGVYHFRRTFTLERKPASFIIHVSADNRYELFVNGRRVSAGPSPGDLWHWRYTTLDIAGSLEAGDNTLAAVVWNFAEHAPAFQISSRTAFLVQGEGALEEAVNTSPHWKCMEDRAYRPWKRWRPGYPAGELFGSGESVNGAGYPWGWETPGYDDAKWPAAVAVSMAEPRGIKVDFNRWFLVPDTIPPMLMQPERFVRVSRADGVGGATGLLSGAAPVHVPPRRRALLLLDAGRETTAYPEILVSGGRGARVEMTYSEALRTPSPGKLISDWPKGNRNEIEGKEAHGTGDEFFPDGGRARLYRPLWWRVYRFLQISVETRDEPLAIEDVRAIFTAYPFRELAGFESSDAGLKGVWSAGWRTALLSSHEFFTDGPYYESLQYVGDMRIMALVTITMSGDDGLVRNGLRYFNDSRLPEGLTCSRYPSNVPQVIPTYSLLWINLLHDYWMYRDGPDFVREQLPAARGILEWFERKAQPSGFPKALGWWPFVDWVSSWPAGVPPGEADGSSTIVALQWAGALRAAEEMETALGDPVLAGRYRKRRQAILSGVRTTCWDERRGLMADSPARRSFSQHANILAVLEDAIDAKLQRPVLERVLAGHDLAAPTLYFRFYLGRALDKAGMGDRYLETLDPWRRMLELGLTTWPETPDEPRSDCHGWSSSPNYELLTTVAGIRPAAPGFRSIRIQPHLGPLQWVRARMPHPKGMIEVDLRETRSGTEGSVVLPAGAAGEFVSGAARLPLKAGRNAVAAVRVPVRRDQ